MASAAKKPVRRGAENAAVILCRPKLSENIGTTARAVANMGMGRLILVDPFHLDWDTIRAAATRAGGHIVDGIAVFEDLPSALADFQYVVGTTARKGSHRGPFLSPRDLAGKVLEMGPEMKVAVVFGTERSGLTTADLRLCQAVVTIPTSGLKTSSLNLAQAVLIIGYELLLAERPAAAPQPAAKQAPAGEVQAMYDNFADTLVRIGFLPDQNTGHWLMSFKRIFNRTGLTHGDCNLIRGLCRQINWALDNPEKAKRRPESKDENR